MTQIQKREEIIRELASSLESIKQESGEAFPTDEMNIIYVTAKEILTKHADVIKEICDDK